MKVGIVGAGLNGLATARFLARSGHDVTVFERFEIGHANGSSHGPVRIFRTAYEDPAWVARAVEAIPFWRELEEEAGERLLTPRPCVNVGPGLDALSAAMRAVNHRWADHAVLRGSDLVTHAPSIRVDADEHVLIEPGAAVIDAAGTVRALASSARANGAQIIEKQRVVGVVDRPAHVEIVHDDGITLVDVVVVAAGAWVNDLLGPLVPQVHPSAETVLYVPVEAEVPILIERGEVVRYALPVGDGTLRAGFSRGNAFAHPDSQDAAVEDDVAAEVVAWIRSRLTVPVGEPTLVQRCMYTMTPDESFVLERHGRIVIASACSGHGFKFAPWTGARVAALVTG
jgi:glycine/D-amino acid oxidase-like deaminating enzyme